MPNNAGDWAEWQRYVLKELERLGNCYEDLRKENSKLLQEVRGLKVQAGLYSAGVATIITVVLTLIIQSVLGPM